MTDKKLIFFVDDELGSQEVNSLHLQDLIMKKFDQFEFQVFSDPLACFDKIQENNNKTFMLISDYLMNDIDGVNFLLEVSRRYPHIRCVLITSWTEKLDELKQNKFLYEVLDKNGQIDFKLVELISKCWNESTSSKKLEK